GLSQVEEIALGSLHSCARTRAGRVFCWGHNYWGQLAETTRSNHASPTPAPGLGAPSRLALGAGATCAGIPDGRVRCAGTNNAGQIARPVFEPAYPVPEVVEGLPPVAGIALGGNHGCATTSEGRLFCWGSTNRGEVGDGQTIRAVGVTEV